MKILLFCCLLLSSTACSHAQQRATTTTTADYHGLWGNSPSQARVHMRLKEPQYELVRELQKENLRQLVYQDKQNKASFEVLFFENEHLVTIRRDYPEKQPLASLPTPQGETSSTEQDTWRDEANDVVTQRRYEDGMLSDYLLSNKANPPK